MKGLTLGPHTSIVAVIIITFIIGIILGQIISYVVDFFRPAECVIINHSLLDDVIAYAHEQGGCVCDGSSCTYWCEKYRSVKNFAEGCQIGQGICYDSRCWS